MSRKPNKYRKIGQAALLGSCIGAGPAGFAAWSLGLTDCRGKMGASETGISKGWGSLFGCFRK